MSARDDNARDEPMPALLEGVPIITRGRPANTTPLRMAGQQLAEQRCLACGERIGSHPMSKLAECAEQVQAAVTRVGMETGEGARGALIAGQIDGWPYSPEQTCADPYPDVPRRWATGWDAAPAEPEGATCNCTGDDKRHPIGEGDCFLAPEDDCAAEHGDACEGTHE